MNDATMPSKAAQRHIVTGAVQSKVLNTGKTFVIISERFDIIKYRADKLLNMETVLQ